MLHFARQLISKKLYIVPIAFLYSFFIAQKASAQLLKIEECGWNEGARYYNDVNCLILQSINIGSFLYRIIGGIAFVMFVYGGFMMILSFGSAERVKKGKDALIASIIGLIIALSAYLLINFVLNALGVQEDLRGV